METVKLEDNSEELLSHIERILLSGGIVVVPTDTVYGIIGDATNPDTIKKIFTIKKRPEEKILPIFVKDIATARRLAYISDAKAKILENLWPGPVTVVFHHKEKLPKVLTGGHDTLAMRIPKSPFLLQLLARLEFPLVQTSANISSRLPAQTATEIEAYFEGSDPEPDLIVDGGVVKGKQSTLINFTKNIPIVLRMGAVSQEEFNTIFEKFK